MDKPVEFPYFPEGQDVQVDMEVAPVATEYVPDPHDVHNESPVVAAYVPEIVNDPGVDGANNEAVPVELVVDCFPLTMYLVSAGSAPPIDLFEAAFVAALNCQA